MGGVGGRWEDGRRWKFYINKLIKKKEFKASLGNIELPPSINQSMDHWDEHVIWVILFLLFLVLGELGFETQAPCVALTDLEYTM